MASGSRTRGGWGRLALLAAFGVVIGALRPGAAPTAGAEAERLRAGRHWAFEEPLRPAPPEVHDDSWARSPLDRFLRARLEADGLQPRTEASRRVLLRRLSFDLTGLPPTPEEIDAFLEDPSPDALERQVDRLLASPRQGERWARHWLDVARFSESQGFEYDRLRPNAWPYRDYVIDSFNADLPYDRFMAEQVAGDVLEPVTSRSIAATGFLVCGPWDQAGNSQQNKTQVAITREEEMDDLVATVAQTLLGLTVNCARCHNHKFDPIEQADYYRLRSVFDGVRHGERPLATEAEISRSRARAEGLRQQIARWEQRSSALVAVGRERATAAALAAAEGPQAPAPGVAAPRSRRADAAPAPVARWAFEEGLTDLAPGGALAGELHGDARIQGGRLVLDGDGDYFSTAPLGADLGAKTLVAWVSLAGLDQGGGGVIGVETLGGSVFDAVVFGERQPGRWGVGSDGFARTQDHAGPAETAEATGRASLIQVAGIWRADGSIELLRNGEPYAGPYTPPSPPVVFKAGEARLLLGLRHTGGGRPYLRGEIEEAWLFDRALTRVEVRELYDSFGGPTLEESLGRLLPTEREEREALRRAIAEARRELESIGAPPVAYVGVRRPAEAVHLLLRGDVRTPGDVVAPGALASVRGLSGDLGLAPDAPDAARRAALARWLIDPHNPLPARALVNRLWHHHFGRGLVVTPNDLGASGEPPSHPELLDWLAASFKEEGWSLKRLHRLMVTSASYRQASSFDARAAELDAENRLLWRFSPSRLDAEEVRDAILAVSGELVLQLGGPSFRPFTVQNFGSDFYTLEDRADADCSRRTIYRMSVASGKDPLLEAFDCPDPATRTPSRRVTTTPLQALSLMNSSFTMRQSAALARRLRREAGDDLHGCVERAYRLLFGRGADANEAREDVEFARAEGLETLAWVLLNASELYHVE